MSKPRRPRILPLMIGPIPVRELMPIVLGLALALALVFGLNPHPRNDIRDQEGAELQEGSGTITDIVFAQTKTGTLPMFLELDGRQVTLALWDSGSALRLHVGEKVRYTYLVGHSRAWYIKQIARDATAGSGGGGNSP